MEKKRYLPGAFKVFGVIFIVFSLSFLYLHQKVLCFVTAYELTGDYRDFVKLVDKKDYLVYNLSKNTSLVKVHQWTEDNEFFLASKGETVELDLRKNQVPVRESKLASLFGRFLRVSADIPKALAKDK